MSLEERHKQGTSSSFSEAPDGRGAGLVSTTSPVLSPADLPEGTRLSRGSGPLVPAAAIGDREEAEFAVANEHRSDCRSAEIGQDRPFHGYPAPGSNTTYTPNQFFDVVLPHSSRGCVRLVAFLFRKTLGWSDVNGNPQEPRQTVSYSTLINEAGISRGMIKEAVSEAIEKRFIRCVKAGAANTKGARGSSAFYELCWDDSGSYITDLEHFNGFFSGNGNLTYIPNAFFDYTVRNEPLAVVRVVGAIIRHTIGFQTKFGFRRQQIKMSFTELQQKTGISSPTALSKALKQALDHNHIVRVEAGYFDTDGGRKSTAATYGIRWSVSDNPNDGSESVAAKKAPSKPSLSEKCSGKTVQKVERRQAKKCSGRGSKSVTAKRFENRSFPSKP